jgi:hypothetical protein
VKSNYHANYLWDDKRASVLDAVGRLDRRSNLLGSDQRVANSVGGNTSSKTTERDPLAAVPVDVLWAKGPEGDLRTSTRVNFSSSYQEKLIGLQALYAARPDKGPKSSSEEERVGSFALATFNLHPRAPSVDATEFPASTLAQFYADRTPAKLPLTPADQAEAHFPLVLGRLSKTTGQTISVDEDLQEAFLR